MNLSKKLLFSIFIIIIFADYIHAQFSIEGDFRTRWYSDQFFQTIDNHSPENYFRFMGRLRGKFKAGSNVTFNTEVISLSDNNVVAARNIQGTGQMKYGISQLYADVMFPDLLVFDLVRLRVGRQQFGVGNGLSLGDSYYYLDKFDGARFDFAYDFLSLTLFGAITKQNLTESGLYPDPGSDEFYVAKLGANVLNQDIIAYYMNQRLMGKYNDHYLLGGGINGSLLNDKLEYFGEYAYQKFNTLPGLPKRSGIGFMGGISYNFSFNTRPFNFFPLNIFRNIKIESRFAAYQGDDEKTTDIEQFSPAYPSFFWGDRTGYVNTEAGGDYPHKGVDLEGSKIFYGRIYFVPNFLPKLRVQFQYIKAMDYTDNDNYNSKDDEFGVRFYYSLTKQTQFQLRFAHTIPNEGDKDVNNSGAITSTEDRYGVNRIMLELNIVF